MLLLLIRHAPASARDATAWPDDRQRPLSPRGERRFQPAARGLRRIVRRPDAVLSSRYARAWRTAELLQQEAGWPAPQPCAELEPGGTPAAALDAVRRYAGQGADDTSVLVGHEPLLSELAALLLTGQPNGASLMFKKGAAACFEFLERLGDSTQPGHRKSGAPRLLWLAQPKLLRALAR